MSAADSYPILQYFRFEHLPPHLQDVSAPFSNLAHALVGHIKDGPEVSAGLRKLLEAKDCFVRARLAVTAEPPQPIIPPIPHPPGDPLNPCTPPVVL